MIYAIIDANGSIINRVELADGWDKPLPEPAQSIEGEPFSPIGTPLPNWTPPKGTTAVAEPEGEAWVIGGTYVDGVYSPPYQEPSLPPPPKLTVSSQELLAQLTTDDIAKIQSAVNSSPSMALLWYSLLAQRDDMRVDNERFIQGWDALTHLLGWPRLKVIRDNLGITI